MAAGEGEVKCQIPDHISVPDCMQLNWSEVDPTRIGVFSVIRIEKGQEFGPFQGRKVLKKDDPTVDQRYSWEVFDLNSLEYMYTIDATKPSDGNWMRYVCCARFFEEQNIVSTQNGTDVFYKALKDINAGEELLTWFQPRKKRRKKGKLSAERFELVPVKPDDDHSQEQTGSMKRKRKPKVIPDSYDGPLDFEEREVKVEKVVKPVKPNNNNDDIFEPLQPGQKRRRRKKTLEVSDSRSATPSSSTSSLLAMVSASDKIEINIDEVAASKESTPEKEPSGWEDCEDQKQYLKKQILAINDAVDWTFPEKGEEFTFVLQRQNIITVRGKKVYKCDICLATYIRLFNLKRHYLRNHINYTYLSKNDMANCLINLQRVKRGTSYIDKCRNVSCSAFKENKEDVNNEDETVDDKMDADCENVKMEVSQENEDDLNKMVEDCVAKETHAVNGVMDEIKSEPNADEDSGPSESKECSDDKSSVKAIVKEGASVNKGYQNGLKLDVKIEQNEDESNSASWLCSSVTSSAGVSVNGVESESSGTDIFKHASDDAIVNNLMKLQFPGLYVCYECTIEFDTAVALRQHLQSNHAHKLQHEEFRCDQCDMQFSFKHNLLRHQLNVHKHVMEEDESSQHTEDSATTDNSSPSKRCGRKQKLCPRSEFSDVKAKVDPQVEKKKVYKCGVCPVKFKAQEDLSEHVQMYHQTSNKFQCKYCGKEFLSLPNMKKHVRFHLGYRATCRECTESFSNVGSLRKHTRIAHPEKYEARLVERLEKYGVLRGPDKNALKKKIAEKVIAKKEAKRKEDAKDNESVKSLNSEESQDQKEATETSAKQADDTTDAVHGDNEFAPDEIDDGGSRFKFSCTVCKKRFSSYVNMCRHRQKAHGKETKSRTEQSSSLDGKKREPSPIRETPEEIAAFYANVAHNIATNLNCHIDGKPESIENFNDHITIEGYAGAFEYSSNEAKVTDFNWEYYNFPSDFLPGSSITIKETNNHIETENIENDYVNANCERNVDNEKSGVDGVKKECNSEGCDIKKDGLKSRKLENNGLVVHNIKLSEETEDKPSEETNNKSSEEQEETKSKSDQKCVDSETCDNIPENTVVSESTNESNEGKITQNKTDINGSSPNINCVEARNSDSEQEKAILAVSPSQDKADTSESSDMSISAGMKMITTFFQGRRGDNNHQSNNQSHHQSNNQSDHLQSNHHQNHHQSNHHQPNNPQQNKKSKFYHLRISDGVIHATDSPATRTFNQVQKGEYANFQDDLLCNEVETFFWDKNPACNPDKGALRKESIELNMVAQQEIENLYTEIDYELNDKLILMTPKSLSQLCEQMLSLTPVTKSMYQKLTQTENPTKLCHNNTRFDEGDADDEEEEEGDETEEVRRLTDQRNITERLGLLQGSEKDNNSVFRLETPDYSDAPETSPFYNYDTIAFGRNGEIQNVCGACKRQFEDVDTLIRHHQKKHSGAMLSVLEVEQGNDIEYMHFTDPTCYGALTATDTGLENTSEVRTFRCTFCSEEFKSMSALHIHIISCSPIDPVYGKQKTEKVSSKTPLRKKVQRKIQSMFNESLSAKAKLDFYSLSSNLLPKMSQKRVFMGCRKWKSVILPGSPVKDTGETAPVVVEKPPQPVISGYNPHKHVRRRELTQVVDMMTCEGCGLKCKTIILLERHVRHCTRKEKFQTMKPLTCPIIDDAVDKVKNMCFYCEKNFTYTKSLINHFQEFCPVKRALLEKDGITEDLKEKEAAILERIMKGEEEKMAIKEKEMESKGKRRITWQVGRKPKKKGFAWTMIKRKNMMQNDESADEEGREMMEKESVSDQENDDISEDKGEKDKKIDEAMMPEKVKSGSDTGIADPVTASKEGENETEGKKSEIKVEKPVSNVVKPVARRGRPRKIRPEELPVDKITATEMKTEAPDKVNTPVEESSVIESPVKESTLDMNTSLNCTARYVVNEIQPIKKSSDDKTADVPSTFLQCVKSNASEKEMPYVRKGRSKARLPSADGIIEGKRKRERVGKVDEFLKNAFGRKKRRKGNEELDYIPKLPNVPNSETIRALTNQDDKDNQEFQSELNAENDETKTKYPLIKQVEVIDNLTIVENQRASIFTADYTATNTATSLEMPKKKGRGRPRKNPVATPVEQTKRKPRCPATKYTSSGDSASITSAASLSNNCVSSNSISDSSNVSNEKSDAKKDYTDMADEQVVPECDLKNGVNGEIVTVKDKQTNDSIKDVNNRTHNTCNTPDKEFETSSDADSVDGDIGAIKTVAEKNQSNVTIPKTETSYNPVALNPHFQVKTCIENNIICSTDITMIPHPENSANKLNNPTSLASISEQVDVPDTKLQLDELEGTEKLMNKDKEDDLSPQCVPESDEITHETDLNDEKKGNELDFEDLKENCEFKEEKSEDQDSSNKIIHDEEVLESNPKAQQEDKTLVVRLPDEFLDVPKNESVQDTREECCVESRKDVVDAKEKSTTELPVGCYSVNSQREVLRDESQKEMHNVEVHEEDLQEKRISVETIKAEFNVELVKNEPSVELIEESRVETKSRKLSDELPTEIPHVEPPVSESAVILSKEDNDDDDAKSDITESTLQYGSREMSPKLEMDDEAVGIEADVVTDKLLHLKAEMKETVKREPEADKDEHTALHTENVDKKESDFDETKKNKNNLNNDDQQQVSSDLINDHEGDKCEIKTDAVRSGKSKGKVGKEESPDDDKLDVKWINPILSPGERVKMNRRSCKRDVDLASPVWIKRTQSHPHLKGEKKDPEGNNNPTSDAGKPDIPKETVEHLKKSDNRQTVCEIEKVKPVKPDSSKEIVKNSKKNDKLSLSEIEKVKPVKPDTTKEIIKSSKKSDKQSILETEKVKSGETVQSTSKGRKRNVSESKDACVAKRVKVEKVNSVTRVKRSQNIN